MKKKHLDLLICPKTHQDLRLVDPVFDGDVIVSGYLKSDAHTYPIRNGIPRFVENQGYSENFGWQWNKWARVQFEDENTGRPMEGHTRTMFKNITDLSESKLQGKTVLDIGCGPGRFVDMVLEMGGIPVALDYSTAIDAAKNNFAKSKSDEILFVQGDALNLPFRNESFDYSYSIGVLHHTPDPKRGVDEAFRVTKTRGEFAISVYSKVGFYTFPSVQVWRTFFKALWPLFGHYPPLIYANVVGRLNHYIRKVSRPLSLPIRLFFPSITLADVRWSVLDTFDSITPSYQSGHSVYEVYSWFVSSGFSTIRVAAWENIIGQK